jgi:hypothetical protein
MHKAFELRILYVLLLKFQQRLPLVDMYHWCCYTTANVSAQYAIAVVLLLLSLLLAPYYCHSIIQSLLL